MEVKKAKRKYDRAFKRETVRLVTEVGRASAEVARELGINVNVIYRWVRQYKEIKKIHSRARDTRSRMT